MFGSLKKKLVQLIHAEKSPKRFSASFCLGTFIAFLPIIPLQTPFLLVLNWFLSLNFAVAFTAAYVVNNPVTLIPIYLMDYAFGVWLFRTVLGFELGCYNPWWVQRANIFLSQYINMEKYLGAGFCIWYLFLGGLVLSLLISLFLYPILQKIFKLLLDYSEKVGDR